jgi:hypothetical protein
MSARSPHLCSVVSSSSHQKATHAFISSMVSFKYSDFVVPENGHDAKRRNTENAAPLVKSRGCLR